MTTGDVPPGRPAIHSLPGAGQPVGPYGDRLHRPVLVNRIPRRAQRDLPPLPPAPAPPPERFLAPPPAVLARLQQDAARQEVARRAALEAAAPDAVPSAASLRARREALGLSQYDLARAAGMGRGHIGEIERDGRQQGAYPQARLRLAAVLDGLEAQAAAASRSLGDGA